LKGELSADYRDIRRIAARARIGPGDRTLSVWKWIIPPEKKEDEDG
jgi:hypothetical protein